MYKERVMHDERTFRDWLKQRRRVLDLTQKDLAQQLGCTLSTIKKLEMGVLRPSKRLAERLANQLGIPPDEHDRFVQFARFLASAAVCSNLTEREVEVLRLVAQGLTNAQVAERLVISSRTVNAHLNAIYRKLDVPSRAAATRFAVERGLI
jgi:DNA-binding CsgD family transcriptional regulator